MPYLLIKEIVLRKLKIISGGQTGVDRAALDVGLSLGLEIGGWCPRGRKSNDGFIPVKYPLAETISSDYMVRTRLNIRDSNGTLIINAGKLEGGTAATYGIAKKYGCPVILINGALTQRDASSSEVFLLPINKQEFLNWIDSNNISILNIAGPREKKRPGIYTATFKYLKSLLEEI